MSSDDGLWADLEAAPYNMWAGEPITGLWCPICNLPSGWKLGFDSDPNAADPGLLIYGCGDNEDHGSAVDGADR
jgi:hypothetical protein